MLARRSRPGCIGLMQLDVADRAPQAVLLDPLAAVLALEPLVERRLEPFPAGVVDVGEAEHVARHFARRVVALGTRAPCSRRAARA